MYTYLMMFLAASGVGFLVTTIGLWVFFKVIKIGYPALTMLTIFVTMFLSYSCVFLFAQWVAS